VTQREDGAWNRERDTYGTQIETHGSLGREVARRSYNNLHVNNNFLSKYRRGDVVARRSCCPSEREERERKREKEKQKGRE